jgi:hypothetical protein
LPVPLAFPLLTPISPTHPSLFSFQSPWTRTPNPDGFEKLVNYILNSPDEKCLLITSASPSASFALPLLHRMWKAGGKVSCASIVVFVHMNVCLYHDNVVLQASPGILNPRDNFAPALYTRQLLIDTNSTPFATHFIHHPDLPLPNNHKHCPRSQDDPTEPLRRLQLG